MSQTIRIATRNSPLALAQANEIKQLLECRHPRLTIEILGFTTTGDELSQIEGKVPSGKRDFLKELEMALLDDHADVAIHSMKDVPSDLPADLSILQVGERMDPRDVLVGAKSLLELTDDSVIGTSSTRRQAFLRNLSNVSNFKQIRGNVGTRLGKLDRQECDVLVLAAAGMHRLGLKHRIDGYLNTKVFVPSAGQGALGAEYRTSDSDVEGLLRSIQNSRDATAVACERDVIVSLEADCNAPIGVYCRQVAQEFELLATVVDKEGYRSLNVQAKHRSAQQLAANVTHQLRSMGAKRLLHDG